MADLTFREFQALNRRRCEEAFHAVAWDNETWPLVGGAAMTPLTVTMNIDDDPWVDLQGARAGQLLRVGGIPLGTNHGNAAVALAIQLEDGSWVIAQTTLRLFYNAARALGARYEDDLK